jgi:hypothetical protein
LSVSEPQRLALHAAARRALGDEEGDTLMALSPPANTEIATLQALERSEERLAALIERSELRTRLWGLLILGGSQLAVVTYLTSTLG